MSITRDGSILHLQSPFYRRDIDLSEGPFSCAVFSRAPDAPHFLAHHHRGPQGIPFEAAVKVDGRWLEAGIHTHRQPLWNARGGAFDVADVRLESGRHGPLATVVCRTRPDVKPRLEMAIAYELSETLPFFRKSMRVTNRSEQAVVVQNLCPEIFYYVRIDREFVFLHDFRRGVRTTDDFYAGYVRYQFPADIDVTLAPGDSVESFNLYGVCTPVDEEGRGVWRQRVLKALAPWIRESGLTVQCDSIQPRDDQTGPEQFVQLASECAANGIEKVSFFVSQIWTNIGDYEVRRDLFPGGEDDLRRVVADFHAKGLQVGVYSSYSIAWHGSQARERHLDWECTGAEGQRFDPGAFGNMCFLSDWGDFIRDKLLWLADDLGFDEIHMDGPTDIPCHQRGHRHRNAADYEYLNWQWERDLFRALRARGKYLTLPRSDSYLLMGISAMPGGYTEEDFCHSAGMEQLVNCRARLYQARHAIPACASWGFLAVDAYHRHGLGISEAQPWIYDHALGGLIGYGHAGMIHGSRLHVGPRTEAVLRKWVAFRRMHRDTLRGDFLHLAAPDGLHVDAVMHTQAGAAAPAVAVVFNPRDRGQTAHLCLPLAYAGLQPGSRVACGDGGTVQLDDRATAALTVRLQPYEVRVVALGG